ncbi:Leucine rich repeat-containing protein [Butyrivibrio fibrisolvens DSM 3071]|uniref:Leucine rich repeat-containing protein n=1 Tax=Butyrivibrio fibrisolvens DSM 3071 TaxID=1121131 RepID=A0A1M5PLR4_BUTFI|nr:leucine-rich repeat domain-containing protein [Butyrivibrio fibrisolvens]SHH02667.1 Leucine rich repeat-containing protein [Butyrivibrio fibrisolvens DSM 3071]
MKKIVILITIFCITIITIILFTVFGLPYIKPVKIPFALKGYEITLEDDYVILNKYVGNDKNVVIPERFLTKPVKVLGDYCFDDGLNGTPLEKKIESVEIPDSVEIIGDHCFEFMSSLKSVTATNVISVGEYAFYEDDGLENVSLGSDLTIIKTKAFSVNLHLVSFDFTNVKEIGDEAFAKSGLTNVTNMQSIEKIGACVFAKTPWLYAQEGDFVIINGSLQLYKGEQQIVVIPDEVKSIDGAFCKYKREYKYPIDVKEVYIPNTVTSISDDSFYCQHNLTVYIPDSVTSIDIFCGLNGNEYSGIGKIVTTADSYAEQFAKENGIPYEIVDSWEVPET